MLSAVGPSCPLFELLLPAEPRVLSGELARIECFVGRSGPVEPFRLFFNRVRWPAIHTRPTNFRVMILKYRYQVGYRRL